MNGLSACLPLKKAGVNARFLYPPMKNFALILILATMFAACQASEEPTVVDTPLETTVTLQEITPTVAVAMEEATPSAEFATALPLLRNGDPPILAQSIELVEVARGLDRLVYLTHAGDDRLFTVAAEGRIYLIEDGDVANTPFLDIRDRVNDRRNEQGLLSIAFHPDYANNNHFFAYYTGDDGETVVSQFTGVGNKADPDSERIILTVPQPYGNHNGGQLQFGDDGYLYIGLGDGGSGGDPDNNGQDKQTLLGSILRIDVNNGNPYAIPADNPFVKDEEAADEIWTYGWRNPWRFSFDRATGDMYIGDVGQNAWEEISFEASGSPGGGNYGWNVYEGSHCYLDDCETLLPGAIRPILEYGRSEGCSITGGYIYRGEELPELNGNYLFGDFCSGTVWASTKPGEMQVVLDSGLSISSFGEDAAGELYVLDIGGAVYKIVDSD